METEINKDVVMKDLESMLKHLINMNKEMQKLYQLLSTITMEVLEDDAHVSENK